MRSKYKSLRQQKNEKVQHHQRAQLPEIHLKVVQFIKCVFFLLYAEISRYFIARFSEFTTRSETT